MNQLEQVRRSELMLRIVFWMLAIKIATPTTFAAAADELRPPQANQTNVAQTPNGEDFQEVWTDRRLIQQSAELSNAVRKLDPTLIREYLWILREADKNFLVPDEHNQLWIPAYRFLFREMRSLPEPIRTQIWIEDESRANAELTKAVQSGDPHELISVIQHFPGSEASCRAFLVLARQQLDRGHLLSALAWLEPLQSSQVEDQWSQTADRFTTEIMTKLATHSAGDTKTTADSDSDADSDSAKPVERNSWHTRLPVSGQVVTSEQELRTAANSTQTVLWSNWEPVLDSDRIYVRTLRGLMAFDRRNGSVDWLFSGAANFETWLSGSSRNLPSGDILPPEFPDAMFSTMEWTRNADLLHRNSVIGQMTQDEEHVYLIDDTLDLDNTPQAAFNVRVAPVDPGRMPSLVALNKNNGRREWTIGGPAMEGQFSNTLAGAWFAGPPSASDHRIFTVAELAGSIHLLQLNPRTGGVIKQVLLGFPQVSIQTDRARRLRMARPFYSSGLIWTETTTGWLCAIDEASFTLLWARRIHERTDEQNTGTRNQPVLMTRPDSMVSAWKASPPLLFQRNLFSFVSESRELLCIDCVNGGRRFSRKDLHHVIALPTNQQRLVLVSSIEVSAVSTDDGRDLWSTLPPDNRLPAGMGTVDSDRVYLPFTDGSVFAFSLMDGTVTEAHEFRNHSEESCQLFGDSDQLFQITPWRLQSIVKSGNADTSTSPAEQVSGLLKENRNADAWQLIAHLTDPLQPDASQLIDLRLRTLRNLLDMDPNSTAQVLAEHLRTRISPRETAVCITLQSEILKKSGDVNSLNDFLLEHLALDEELLQQDVGPFVRRQADPDGPTEDSEMVFHQSLQQWLLRQLESQLAVSPPSESNLLKSVAALDDRQLLRIRSGVTAEAVFGRLTAQIEAHQLNELTLQLLAQYRALSTDQQNDTRYRQRLHALHESLVEAGTENDLFSDPAHREVSEALLESLLLDDDRNRRRESGVDEPSGIWRPRLLDDDTEWSGWKDQPYRIIPISQSVSFRESEQKLTTRSTSDSFMNEFDWSLIRVPAALKAVAKIQGQSLTWTVPGTFPTSPPSLLGSSAEIQRFNSVILIQTQFTVTGVSAVDRRVLWMRKVPDGAQGTAAANFYQRQPFRDPSNNARIPPGFIRRASVYFLMPAGPRLAVMQTDRHLSVFDTYTGEELWSLNGDFEQELLFVGRSSLVLFDPHTSSIQSLKITDGSPTETGLTAQHLKGAIGTGDNHLVVWNKMENPQPNELHWIDFESGSISHRLQLPDQSILQYLDSDTLTATSKEQLSVISFQYRTKRDYRSNEGWFAEPESPVDASMPDNVLHVMTDKHYLYILRATSTERDQIAGMLTGRASRAMSGQLTALDRTDGKKLWSISTGRATATFDHRTSPVLLLLEVVRPENGAQAAPLMNVNGNQMIIRGILKTTGTTLFEHRQSSRYPIPIVEMETGTDFSIDIEAFGSRARFVPAASIQAVPSFPEN